MRSSLFSRALLFVFSLAIALGAGVEPKILTIVVDGHSPGRVFDGVGVASGGGCVARLLINYPEPQRSQILDFLFKPNYGASVQSLKVEIGGDGNSTEGSEPSHMHSPGDENYNRGFEWWVMKEAKRRNPRITLHALAWDFPGWLKEANSQATADYLVKWLLGTRREHGLDIDTIGIWNETKMDYAFIKTLKRALTANGLKTKIIADDLVNTWAIVDAMGKDKELADAIDIVATHYVRFKSTDAARNIGKPIWSSEEGPWNDAWGSAGDQGGPYAEALNRNYIDGRMTSTMFWCLVTAYYDILDIPYAGLLRADTPWSGRYELKSPLWVVAHTTQFAKPGWQYLDSACLHLPRGGSCVALKRDRDYSVILETLAAREAQEVQFSMKGGLSTGRVHIWRSNPSQWFERIQTIHPRDGLFKLQLEPNSVYSITTTSGQRKGSVRPTPTRSFALPYRDTFERYPLGCTTPNYFIEQNGSYEVVKAGGGRKGRALRQVMNQSPIVWTYGHTAHLLGTASIIGDKTWSNYRVTADVFLEEPGYASVLGRISRCTLDGAISGYQLRLYDSGQWELREDTDKGVVASGMVSCGLNTWHRLDLSFNEDLITTTIDRKVVSENRHTHFNRGMAGIGNGYNLGQYADFQIAPLPGVPLSSTNQVLAAGPPAAPTLFVPSPANQAVRLSWTPVDGATAYAIKFGTEADHYPSRVEVGALTAYTITTLTNGKEYHFVVVASNEKGESKASNSMNAVPTP
jgi:hypothetical protein